MNLGCRALNYLLQVPSDSVLDNKGTTPHFVSCRDDIRLCVRGYRREGGLARSISVIHDQLNAEILRCLSGYMYGASSQARKAFL